MADQKHTDERLQEKTRERGTKQARQQAHNPDEAPLSQTPGSAGRSLSEVTVRHHKPGAAIEDNNGPGDDQSSVDYAKELKEGTAPTGPYDPRTHAPIDNRSVESAYATRDNIVLPPVTTADGRVAHPEREVERVVRVNRVVEAQNQGLFVERAQVPGGLDDEKEVARVTKDAEKRLDEQDKAAEGDDEPSRRTTGLAP